jgi:hypothetical protein
VTLIPPDSEFDVPESTSVPAPDFVKPEVPAIVAEMVRFAPAFTASTGASEPLSVSTWLEAEAIT